MSLPFSGESPFNEPLEALQRDHLFREILPLAGSPGKKVIRENRECLNCASNNYLDLAQHPKLIAAAIDATRAEGVGSGGSRLLGGATLRQAALESVLEKYRPIGEALLFNTGFMANMGLIQALSPILTPVFSDHLNHASVAEGLLLLRASHHRRKHSDNTQRSPFYRFHHGDLNHLETLLKQNATPGKSLVVTETLFSMEGDFAAWEGLLALQRRYEFWLMWDEAHSTGCVPGWMENVLSQAHERMIIMGTFGKAFGGFGAYVVAPPEVKAWLIQAARPFIFSTALPPSIIAAAHEALNLVASEPWRALTLARLASRLRQALLREGFDIAGSQSHIVPVVAGTNEKALQWSKALFDQGIHAPAVRHPTVPKGRARLRINLTAAFTESDVDHLVNALITVRSNCNLTGPTGTQVDSV